MNRFFLFFALLIAHLFAERGIVVSTNDFYAKQYLLGSLIHLRETLHCHLPIEIWHDGNELSEAMKEKLRQISDVTFCNFETVFKGVYGSLRGWHSKPFMLLGTHFTELCLMDADVYFFKNPEVLFKHIKYIQTGALFFRDRWNAFPQIGEEFSLKKYLHKRSFYRDLVKYPSPYVPTSMLHIWNVDRIPTLDSPLPIDIQESGCIFINKDEHKNGILKIVDLTTDRESTHIYDVLFGDKETYWLGLELSGESYAFNTGLPCVLHSTPHITGMIHLIDGELFFQQKEPIKISHHAEFRGRDEFSGKPWKRSATKQEKKILHKAYTSYLKSL